MLEAVTVLKRSTARFLPLGFGGFFDRGRSKLAFRAPFANFAFFEVQFGIFGPKRLKARIFHKKINPFRLGLAGKIAVVRRDVIGLAHL